MSLSFLHPVWLLFCVCDGTSPLHPLTHLYFFVHLLNFVYFLCRVSPHLPFGLSVFVFDHFNFSFRAVAEVTPSPLLFDYVQLLSPLFLCAFPCVSFNLLLSPPTRHPPLRSASCGLIVAPAHTSARHEAVRVWLESVSGGSADLKGIDASRLSLHQLGLFLQHAQTHNCVLTSMLAAQLLLCGCSGHLFGLVF